MIDPDTFFDRFNLCGCGDTEQAMKFLHDALRVTGYLNKVWEGHLSYDQWEKDVIETLGESRHLVWYWMDQQGLTEHGGSVPGFLTPKGKTVLNELKEYFELNPYGTDDTGRD